MKLSVIIVNYKVKYFLEQCLCSVLKACKEMDAEIWVVDNDSTDGSREYFKDKFPSIRFIWNEANVGFSKANNQALRLAKGEFVLFLNPDTIVPEDGLSACIRFLENQQDAGALGVRMIDGGGNFLKESKRGFPSPSTALFKLFGCSALFPRSSLFARYYIGHLPETATNKTEVLAGAFLMAKKDVLDKTGGFDEDYFMYGEDVDLSYRITQLGYANYYFAGTTIIHFKGESTRRDLNYLKLFYGAMDRFVKKQSSSRMIVLNGIIRLGIYFRAGIAALMLGWKRLFSKRKSPLFQSALIIGSADDCRIISDHLVKTQGPSNKITCCSDLADSISIKKAILNSAAKNIVLCESVLSFKEMIGLINTINQPTRFWFHAHGSFSMVGSGDKDLPGGALGWNRLRV